MTHMHACDGISLEGIREGEPRVFRGILKEQSRESFGGRDEAKDTEYGFRFFQEKFRFETQPRLIMNKTRKNETCCLCNNIIIIQG